MELSVTPFMFILPNYVKVMLYYKVKYLYILNLIGFEV